MLRRRKSGARSAFGGRYVQLIRWPERLLKGVAWLVIVTYLSVTTINPAVAAVRSAQSSNEQHALEVASIAPAESYGHALTDLKQVLSNAARHPASAALQTQASLDAQRLFATLDTQRESMNAWWKSQLEHMQSHHLAPEIIARQAKLEQAWREKDQQLQSEANAIRHATDAPSLAAAQGVLLAFLKKELHEKRADLVNHNNLPWQTLKANARKPIENGDQLRAMLSKPRPASQPASPSTKSAAAQPDAHVGRMQEVNSQQIATTPAALTGVSPPTAADLAETIDAPFTADIRQQATDLGNNPVAIFNWVHDNVAFFPSYGSVQGAQNTLDKLSGNAFDQASLLIALLRSSGVPARYVYGTINLPVDQVMNWVGGVQTVNAAQQILGQGGIPNVALTSGGIVKMIRIEHVWVEAYVNYNPSRGTKATPGDAWVPLDPSWKQYAFNQGMDLQHNVAFDANGFLAAAQQGATVNQTEGWVQNVNQANLQGQITAYQNQVKSYITSIKSGATMGDILGTQKIKARNLAFLPASTPYPVQTLAARYSELPDSLRHHFHYQIFDNPDGVDYGSPAMDWSVPTVVLAGKKLTMAWVAATQADEDALNSYLPKPHADGSPIQQSEYPTTLPASIKVKLELRLQGAKVAGTGAYSLGTELIGVGAFSTYSNLAQYDQTQDQLLAGQQSALGVSIQGVSVRQMADLQTRMSDTKSRIAAQNTASLTGELIGGDLLTSTIWSYFASLDSYGVIAQRQVGVIDRPGLSYGLFHDVLQPNLLYGFITTSVSFKGGNLDVGHLRNIRWVRNDGAGVNDAQNRWAAYNMLQGEHSSAMEHAVPERLWIDRSQCQYIDPATSQVVNPSLAPCAEGVSAVKALQLAEQAGQKVFTITSANASVAIPQLQQSSSVVAEVQSAVAAGKTVTIHEKPITQSGWTGTGYVETDPGTGAGAYLIEGAGNGGFLKFLGDHSTAIGFSLFVGGLLVAAFFPAFLLLFGIIALVIAELIIYQAYLESVESAQCDAAVTCIQEVAIFIAALAVVFGVVGLFAEPVVALVCGMLGLIYADDLLKAAAAGCNTAACQSAPPDLN